MVRTVVRVAIGLDFGDSESHGTMPDLLPQQVTRDLQGVTCIEIARKKAARHG
jgi:hypothetical protein